MELLLRTTDFTNMKVIADDNGQQLGLVSDVVIDDKNKILAFMVNSDDPNQAKAFKFSDVKEIVGTNVIVKKADNVTSAKEIIKFENGNNKSLVKKKLVTKDGKELGVVEDFYFDTKSGTAKEVEYSSNGNRARVATNKIKIKEDKVEIKPQQKDDGANPIDKVIEKIKDKIA